ncbi:MAG: type II 3-dehydroquinate dehydratase [Gammaproteobacteria bacterium]|nr:type II 3-dehydroquinate dehydratase [Gammaproteobacteria bacterium]
MAELLLINGPNLNLLGEREPEVYGKTSLADIESEVGAAASAAGLGVDCFQSNAEHEIVERIQAAGKDGSKAILINPAAFTHTSVAIRDALAAIDLPFWEIHLSNVHRREPFRRHSYLSDLAEGVIAGFGPAGYVHAVEAAARQLG